MTTEPTDHETGAGPSTFTWDQTTTSGPGLAPAPASSDPDTLEIHLLAAGHTPADVAAQIGRTPEAVTAKLNDPMYAAQLAAVNAMQGLWAIEHLRARLPAEMRRLCVQHGAEYARLHRAATLEYLDKLEQQLEREQERAWAQQEA